MSRVDFSRANLPTDVAANASELYRFSVTSGLRQRLHFTTCDEATNVDTFMAAYVDTVMASEAIATNDDDDACSGGASTLTVDVDAVASGEPFDLFIAVGYRQRPKPATTGASRASKRGVHYELLLMCEDLPVLALEQATPHLDLLADAVGFSTVGDGFDYNAPSDLFVPDENTTTDEQVVTGGEVPIAFSKQPSFGGLRARHPIDTAQHYPLHRSNESALPAPSLLEVAVESDVWEDRAGSRGTLGGLPDGGRANSADNPFARQLGVTYYTGLALAPIPNDYAYVDNGTDFTASNLPKVFPLGHSAVDYDPIPWHDPGVSTTGQYDGNATVAPTCRPLPEYSCNETLYGITRFNSSEDAEMMPLYAFNVTRSQYGSELEFTMCTEDYDGFDGFLTMYGSCASGANDTIFAVPANATDADGFCASDSRSLSITVQRKTNVNGLQFVIHGGEQMMASPSGRLSIVAGETYIFNQSDPSNHGYEFSLSLEQDGLWGSDGVGNGTEYDPAEHSGASPLGDLVYFVDGQRVNRSTYQKAIGVVHGAEWLDEWSGVPQSRFIRFTAPMDLPDIAFEANAHGRDSSYGGRLFYFSPDRKDMGSAMAVIGEEELETSMSFYFTATPRFVMGLEGNETFLPFENGDAFEFAVRFGCGPVPPTEATPEPTAEPTSEPTVEACNFEPFQCFDLFEGSTDWAVGGTDGFSKNPGSTHLSSPYTPAVSLQ